MVHVHSAEARVRRRQTANDRRRQRVIERGLASGKPWAIPIEEAIVKDPWQTCDPWAQCSQKKLEAANRAVDKDFQGGLLPSCQAPALELSKNAQPFVPACVSMDVIDNRINQFRQEYEGILQSAMQLLTQKDTVLQAALSLIEMQNATIAMAMQGQANDQPRVDTLKNAQPLVAKDDGLKHKIEEAVAKEKIAWKAEVEKMMEEWKQKTASALRETIDEKDKQIDALRSAVGHETNGNVISDLSTPYSIAVSPQPRVDVQTSSQSDDEDDVGPQTNHFVHIEKLEDSLPKEWHPLFKKTMPVTARCVYCMQSLDPSTGAWRCSLCGGVVHAYDDWDCKLRHECRRDSCNGGCVLLTEQPSVA